MGTTISLHSNGGDFQVGLGLAEYFSNNMLETVVDDGEQCLSACAIAFLGGASAGDEDGQISPGRSIGESSRLGFHAPYINAPEAQYSKKFVEGAYDRAVKTVVNVAQYADVFKLDAVVITELMRAVREQLEYVDTAGELGRYKIALRKVKMPSVLTKTMAASFCANGWDWTHNAAKDPNWASMDAFSQSIAIMNSSHWNEEDATVWLSYEDKWVTAVPILEGNEGTYVYCLIERGNPDEGRYVSCNGFVRLGDLAEAVGWAKGNNSTEYPCEIPFVVDPEGKNDNFSDRYAYALVPPSTPIDQVRPKLDQLVATERPIPGPK
ncbi:hypothetical protein X729_24270 [Mesorhizobium sp. L103C131B0]|nr:hypothetical protein X729_24270 [Mesorhizobium sp. L103C131B0]